MKYKQVLNYFQIKLNEITLLRLIQNIDFSKESQLQKFRNGFDQYVAIGGNHPSIINFELKLKNKTLERALLQIMVKGNRSIFFLVRSEIQLFHQLLSEYTNNGGHNESITRFSDRQGIKASKPLNLFASLVEFVKYVLWIGWDRMWLFSLVALLLATIYLMVILCLATFGIDMSKIFIFDLTNSNLSS